jgi:hypothetical protein
VSVPCIIIGKHAPANASQFIALLDTTKTKIPVSVLKNARRPMIVIIIEFGTKSLAVASARKSYVLLEYSSIILLANAY